MKGKCEFVLEVNKNCDSTAWLRVVMWPSGPQEVELCEMHYEHSLRVASSIFARQRSANKAAKKRREAEVRAGEQS